MPATTTATIPDLAAYDVILINSSGGKDSQATLHEVCTLAAAAGVLQRVTVLHCALGHVEWPGTSELARKQAEHYGVRFEERHREQGLLLDQVRRRGRWPSSSARYCTSDQKRGPARKLITQLVAELGDLPRPALVLNCMGLRAEESRARLKKARLTRDEAASSGRRTIDTWLPIHDWTEEQVWQCIRASGVPYHPAYDQGMTRLSCSLCVLASRADLVRAARLRPTLAAEYAELEAEIGHRFRNDLSMADIITAAEQAAAAEHTEETETIELGQGQLWWPRSERQTDRYGTVFLLTGPDGDTYVSFGNAPVGQPGRLVAVVVETRRSGHCGDIARSLAPTTPTVGEEITLGAGTLFTETDADLGVPTAVGLVPDDQRDTDWLVPRALYRCHNQTVRLELRVDSPTNGRVRDTRPRGA
ncbi:phosphoadenosine phosphosulfate reductase family protein [Amycolatopsis saalfeldensis]|uniref:3'-phosphoadenosine 5'-phosphosulfate sulfotransferase (PAPS reductase)/FAD synthetase n=1 Tax=Amycolatopsis saalfeldensis TaxID=394193 RepID=A0A1H8YEN9_9PSEU|nr:phosphoadenosine phosphosulfate reductase family protein [Amycolatopsis saalfeldensis]SEP50605.1 3'-phosphoadenosine 5'-phosphosulfate sulfotransferase (PAPS reductase)/FAD synthetase [Amycolatopsis saalfeldensis]